MNKLFITAIEDELKERGWSQSELAKRSDINPSTLSLILSGDRNPGPDICLGVARAFDLPPEDVFRTAGLLPPKTKQDHLIELITHLASQLHTEEDKNDVIEYIRMRRRIAEKREKNVAAESKRPKKTS
jgi:transcriptional regulator with XRE-family HTH domain